VRSKDARTNGSSQKVVSDGTEKRMSKKRSRGRPKKGKARPVPTEGPRLSLESFQDDRPSNVPPVPDPMSETSVTVETVTGHRDGSTPRHESDNVKLLERSGPRVSSLTQAPKVILESIRSPERLRSKIKAMDIDSGEVQVFLDNLSSMVSEKRSLGIYFHNDMDGLNGALLIRSMLCRMVKDLEVNAYPIEYSELPRISLSDDMVYVFIDIETTADRPNVFRIDHHHADRDMKMVHPTLVLLSPPEEDYLYPSTSTGLCAYLGHVLSGGRLSYLGYLSGGPWHQEPMTRALLLLSSVCDNLWHLNFVTDIPIKRWIPDPEEERNLILISISASLQLGSDERRRALVERFFGEEPTLEGYMGLLMTQLTGARNVLSFSETVSKEIDGFYNRVFFNITDSIDRSTGVLARDKEMLTKLLDSMPIDMKGNREKMMELLKTKGKQNNRSIPV